MKPREILLLFKIKNIILSLQVWLLTSVPHLQMLSVNESTHFSSVKGFTSDILVTLECQVYGPWKKKVENIFRGKEEGTVVGGGEGVRPFDFRRSSPHEMASLLSSFVVRTSSRSSGDSPRFCDGLVSASVGTQC